jgi:prepilin-type N-terminal cleavage/methylation domain-containing protein
MSFPNFWFTNMTSKSRTRHLSTGFTLVELLVAIAVLAIIIVAASQILSTAAKLTTVTSKHMDANDQARMVFDRMANDFARMTRRNDADFIFYKNVPAASPPTTGINDVMYFYTEGASYFDTTTFSTSSGYSFTGPEKNAISLVGYRINNFAGYASATPPTQVQDPDYYQLERLGKALSWDGGPYVAGQPNMAVFLTYPPPGTDAASGDPTGIGYSTAYFNSTLLGAYSNNASNKPGQLPSAVGSWTLAKVGVNPPVNFTDSADSAYRSIGSQIFRFEYSFQLKDGTLSDKPMMVYTGAGGLPGSNGVASGFTLTGGAGSKCPVKTDDSSSSAASISDGGPFAPGSRWWDPKRQIGYICVDATPNYAVWHEIGIQDVAAIIVTIAVIDKQGLTYLNARGGTLLTIAAKLPDYSPTITGPNNVKGNPDYLLDSSNVSSWTYALLPGKGVSTIAGASKLPQAMISQIRVYQRWFYLNNF